MDTSLDFTIIDTSNCKTIGIVDTSYYNPSTTIGAPTLKVYRPGFKNPVTINLIPRKVNIINSNDLGFSNTNLVDGLLDLSDGIYRIQYTINPADTYSVEKTFIRVCKLQCKYDSALLKLDVMNCDDPTRKSKLVKLREIEFLIASSIAASNVCNNKLAIKLYERANIELDRFERDCTTTKN